MNPSTSLMLLASLMEGNPLLGRLVRVSLELAVLAAAVALLIALARPRTPRLRALLWLLVLAKPVLGLLIGAPWPLLSLAPPAPPAHYAAAARPATPGRSALGVEALLAELDSQDPAAGGAGGTRQPFADRGRARATQAGDAKSLLTLPDFHLSLPALLDWLWLAGVAGGLLLTAADLAALRRLCRAAAAPGADLNARYRRLALGLGLKFVPELRVSPTLSSPALVGLPRPVVLLPAWLAESAAAGELDWLLRHELMHWRLRDPVALALRRLAEILFFFHPLVWWAGRRWEEAMELACDRALLSSEADARSYAEQLYRVLELRVPRRAPMLRSGLCATRTQIGRRIASLLSDPLRSPARLSALSVAGFFALTLLVMSVGVGVREIKAAQGSAVPASPSAPAGEAARILQMALRWNFEQAIPAAAALLEKAGTDSERARAHLLLAHAYKVKGIEYRDPAAQYEGRKQIEEAIRLDPALRGEPDAGTLRAALATYRQPRSACQDALDQARKEVTRYHDAPAYFYLGRLYLCLADNAEFAWTAEDKNKQYALAIENLKKTTALNPKSPEAWEYYVTALYVAQGAPAAATAGDAMLKTADLAQDRLPQSCCDPWVTVSGAMSGEESDAYLRRQAGEHPDYLQLQLQAALTWDKKAPRRCAEMLEALAKKIESGALRVPLGRSAVPLGVLYQLGGVYIGLGRQAAALDCYQKIIALSPHYAEVQLNLGIIHQSQADATPDKQDKIRLLQQARRDFENQLAVNFHDDLASVRGRLDQVTGKLKALGVDAGPAPAVQDSSRATSETMAPLLDQLLARQKADGGRDNAMIHYVRAIMTQPKDMIPQSDRITRTLNSGWQADSEPLRPLLTECATAFAEIKKGVALDYATSPGFSRDLNPLVKSTLYFQLMSKMLCIAGLQEEDQGNTAAAIDDYLAVMTMGRDLGVNGSILIGGLLGLAVERSPRPQLARLVKGGKLPRPALQRIQERLRALDATRGTLEQWLHNEFDGADRMVFQQIRRDPGHAEQLVAASFGDTLTNARLTPGDVIRDLDRIEADGRRFKDFVFKTLAVPYGRRDHKAIEAERNALLAALHPVARELGRIDIFDIEGRFLVARSMLLQLRLAAALELYRQDHGRYPAALDQLTTAILESPLPADPFTGQPFEYQLAPDGGSYTLTGAGPQRSVSADPQPISYDPTNGTMSPGNVGIGTARAGSAR